jgi:hypothetical protein
MSPARKRPAAKAKRASAKKAQAKSAAKKPARKRATAPRKPDAKKPARKGATAPRKPAAKKARAKKARAKKPLTRKDFERGYSFSAEELDLGERASKATGESLEYVLGFAAMMSSMEGTTIEESLREHIAWAGIEEDDLDEWAEKEKCKCGRPMPYWDDRKAYPFRDGSWRFYEWTRRRCKCGFAPEEITGALEPPKTKKR